MIKRSIREENIKIVNIYAPNIRLPWWLSQLRICLQFRRYRRRGFSPWIGKICQRRKWQPTPVLLPGKSHGERSLVGYSPSSHKELDWAQSCPTLWDHMDWLYSSRLLCPWDFPGNNTGVGCHSLLQGIFPTNESNPHLLRLLHCRQILYHLSHTHKNIFKNQKRN